MTRHVSGRRFVLAAVAGLVTAAGLAGPARAFFPPPPRGGTGGIIITDPTPPPTVTIPPLPDDPFNEPPTGGVTGTPPLPNYPCDCPPPHTNNTPEPATVVMGLMGLVVAGGAALRKRLTRNG